MAASRPNSPHRAPSYIVGLGGSAGSIEAFRHLLAGLDSDTGMAFVFVLHLPPGRESALVDVLQRWTPMRVCEAADGLLLEPNSVYVIPPDHDLLVERGHLRTKFPRTKSVRHHQVDIFLKSLAADAGRHAVAVILSGGDGDGAEGIAAIKFHGGMTLTQDTSARVDSMPEKAQATGCVDEVLAPAQIAAELNALARNARAVRSAV
jgi:two-component system, chemotaxis family, CheB/CheR fusion protein